MKNRKIIPNTIKSKSILQKRIPKSLIKKQIKLISSRLMQISFKVDDYVYNLKPISVQNAKMFIEEVAGYRDKCYEDRRSLQVIEKLIRCLHGIIAEQQELDGDVTEPNVTVVEINSILASPVDDDMTQYTQGDKDFENGVRVIELKDHRRDINDRKLIGSNVDLDYNIEKPISINVEDIPNELQRAISNLSLAGENDPLTLDCSPSILNNVDTCSNMNIDKHSCRNVYGEDFEQVIKTATIKNVTAKRVPKTRKPKQLSSKQENTLNPTVLSTITQNKPEVKKNITKEKVPRKKRNANQNTNKNNEKITSVELNKQKNVVEVVTKAPEKCLKFTEKINKSDAVKINKPIQNNKHELYREATEKSKQVRFENLSVTPVIYNKHTENDLSWIENIRYIREVAPEESIQVCFDDEFWENYMLPPDWSDNDFIYN